MMGIYLILLKLLTVIGRMTAPMRSAPGVWHSRCNPDAA
jgi:hypothetical protein